MVTVTGRSSTNARTPAGRPPRVSAAGRMPRTMSRMSRLACWALRSASSTSGRASWVSSSAAAASCRVTMVCTRRCWALSWTSRCSRRRVSSAAATTRARDAVSFALFPALAMAAAASCAKCSRRSSVPAAGGRPLLAVQGAPDTAFDHDRHGHRRCYIQLSGGLLHVGAFVGLRAARAARSDI